MQLWESLRTAKWEATILPLPRGYYGAASVGMLGDEVVGNLESAGTRSVGCRWIDAKPVKMEAAKSESVKLQHAAGVHIVGGRTKRGGKSHALLWTRGDNGNLVSISLHSDGYEESNARGCDDDWQVGVARRDGSNRAMAWRGHAQEFVELPDPLGEPAGARAVAAGYAVGLAGWPARGLLWNLESQHVISLHPRQSEWSEVLAIGDGEQAGWFASSGEDAMTGKWKPAVWRGSAGSVTMLLPAEFEAGQAYDCTAGVQAGFVRQGDMRTGVTRATLWGGTADAFLILHDSLPEEWSDSCALSIHVRPDEVIVLGEVKIMSPNRRGIAARQIAQWRAPLKNFRGLR